MDPFSIALVFLKRWWKEILIVLVIAGAVFYVWNLRSTVKEQAVTITQLEMANKTLKDSNKTLTNTVTANNKTIAELSKGAAQTKEDFMKLNAQVEAQTAILTKRLKSILNQPAPVTCDETIQYLIDAVPTYNQ